MLPLDQPQITYNRALTWSLLHSVKTVNIATTQSKQKIRTICAASNEAVPSFPSKTSLLWPTFPREPQNAPVLHICPAPRTYNAILPSPCTRSEPPKPTSGGPLIRLTAHRATCPHIILSLLPYDIATAISPWYGGKDTQIECLADCALVVSCGVGSISRPWETGTTVLTSTKKRSAPGPPHGNISRATVSDPNVHRPCDEQYSTAHDSPKPIHPLALRSIGIR